MTIDRNKVNMILAEKKMSITEFCKKANFSRNRFYTILNSKKVTPKTVGIIAKLLEVSIKEIIETEK